MSTLVSPRLREGAAYRGLVLGGFTALAAALLVLADAVTREPIALRRAEDMNASLSQVIPTRLHENDLLAATLRLTDAREEPVLVYRGIAQGQVSAVAFEVVGSGYAGEIRTLLGLAPDGSVLGARVLSHKETPGLGDKIEAAKDDWILGFEGLSLGNPLAERWGVKKDGGDFDQFSGATITPRAVVRSLKDGLEFFAAQRETILTMPSAGPVAAAASPSP